MTERWRHIQICATSLIVPLLFSNCRFSTLLEEVWEFCFLLILYQTSFSTETRALRQYSMKDSYCPKKGVLSSISENKCFPNLSQCWHHLRLTAEEY